MWEHNPYLTALDENDPAVEVLECQCPLIDQANDVPYHYLHAYMEFLNEHLGLRIKPTEFKGDLHLSDLERSWFSQVYEVTNSDLPFWIVSAGGKYDVTIKWWETRRYQEVIDYFQGSIQFVQIGAVGHHHPKLKGVIDLRGATTLRELVRLVHHAQGVLCGVTALMHLAAAVQGKDPAPLRRPCVVIAGAREPVHWEAYSEHQFIHTTGALPCAPLGGCWKDRTFRLNDGDERDGEENLCSHTVGLLPRCMDMISSRDVIRRIEGYFAGGVARYLTPAESELALAGQRATSENSYDNQPLNLHNARVACEAYLTNLPPYPGGDRDRGIIICAGGETYFTCAWVCLQILRRLGCTLPIQFWYLGRGELDERMEEMVAPFGVECVDATEMRKAYPIRRLHGWELKSYALIHTRFREIVLLDADNVPLIDPEILFETPEFSATGAIFLARFREGRESGSRVEKLWARPELPPGFRERPNGGG